MKFRFNSQKFPVRILLFFVVGVIILSPVLYTGSLKAGQNPRSLFLQHCNSPAEAVPVPTVKDESLAAQKDFCNRLRAQHDGLPSSISVSWSNRQTQNMWDLSMLEEFESNLDDPNRAVLQKVDGIMGAQGTFSMYIFDNQNGQSDIVSSSLKNSKTWERNEIDKLLQQLQLFADRNNLSRSETYLVDIGSNIGYFSLSAAAAGFQVIAVEAMSVNQFAMRMSICANEEIGLSQAITLIPVALSFQNIHCDLFSAGFNALDGFIRCGSPEQLEALTASTGSIKRQDIEVARLDDVLKDWIPSLAGRVGALKIDTEGLEPFIIQGGPTFLSKVKPAYIQMEVSSMSVDATNVDAVKLLNWMELFGYAVHESADGPRKEPKNITILNPGPQNVFLYAEESVVPS